MPVRHPLCSRVEFDSPPSSLRGAKRHGNPHPPPRHCEERSDVAIHTHPPLVIARSKATWQSIPTPSSLRGAKRRGNPHPPPRHCEERSDVAIHTHPPLVIARSKATWQSIPTPSSLRGAKRRGNLYSRWCRTQDGLLRLRLAMTEGDGSQ